MVQEVGVREVARAGITLIAADSPNAFQDDTPTAKLVRQVLGAIAEWTCIQPSRQKPSFAII